MISISELKKKSLNILKISYLEILIVSIILSILTSYFNVGILLPLVIMLEFLFIGPIVYFIMSLISIILILSIVLAPMGKEIINNLDYYTFWIVKEMIKYQLLYFIYLILIGNIIEVAGMKYYIDKVKDKKVSLSIIVQYFRNNRYKNVMVVMILKLVYTTLWTFILIVPGIVKNLEYSMIPYILAENPEMEKSRVFDLSKKMTNGYKKELFILYLSFIPWYILGYLLFIVGMVAVKPYYAISFAEFYVERKNNLEGEKK